VKSQRKGERTSEKVYNLSYSNMRTEIMGRKGRGKKAGAGDSQAPHQLFPFFPLLLAVDRL